MPISLVKGFLTSLIVLVVGCTAGPGLRQSQVILEDEYLSVDGLTVGVEGSTPVAYCKTKDVSSASHGDTLAFAAQTDLDGNTLKGAKTYSVVNVQPDNTGITALILQEQ